MDVGWVVLNGGSTFFAKGYNDDFIIINIVISTLREGVDGWKDELLIIKGVGTLRDSNYLLSFSVFRIDNLK